ncbi:MAG: hypothetical protein COA83_00360 [Methylophaga sp.]|nr:MAG: hypothetical protein COA83_00360 [Methylophaga sp.]
MMKKISYLILLLLPLSSWAAKDLDPKLIDPDWIKVSEQLAAATEKRCAAIENAFKKLDCRGEVRIEFKKQGDYRGVADYINKHYQHLDKQGLSTLIAQNKALRIRARNDSDLPPSSDFEPGELNTRILDVELEALETLLKNKSPKPCVVSGMR